MTNKLGGTLSSQSTGKPKAFIKYIPLNLCGVSVILKNQSSYID